jgi:cell wall-associated NlpC family hydrolase
VIKVKKKIFILILLFTSVCFYSCSSSSYSSRYNNDSDKNKDEIKSQQRFSDKEGEANAVDSLQEEDDEIPDDQGIDITSVMSQLNSDNNETDLDADNGTLKEKMLMEIIKYLNTPYKYGGNSTRGIDCSAFTQTVYNNVLSFNLNRSAREQYKQGIEVDNPEDLKFGDLVFFNTRRRVKPGHVGIYIGDNLFAHASSRNGVIVSSLDQSYYSRRFMGGRRIEPQDIF